MIINRGLWDEGKMVVFVFLSRIEDFSIEIIFMFKIYMLGS